MPATDYRFEASSHTYYLNGKEIPHITGLLTQAGLVDDTWFTEESCERGSVIHRLTADYDLGGIPDPAAVECAYKGWFLAHVWSMGLIHPTWKHVEMPFVSPEMRFGGRPDRVGKMWGALSVLELKTGQPSKATPIQLALQALLVAPACHLPPVAIRRYELRLRENGRGSLFEHTHHTSDFAEARRILKEYA